MNTMSAMNSEAHATDEYKERLSEAINQAIAHTLIDLDGEILTLGEAIRKYRGGNYLATKWRKCSEKQPETARPALVYLGGGCIEVDCWNGKIWTDCGGEKMHPTHWMNLPSPPVPEGGAEDG